MQENIVAAPLSHLPFALLVMFALAAVAAAVVLHFIRRPELPQLRWGLAAARMAATFLAWWLVIVALANLGDETSDRGRLIFATTWPLALWSFFGALGTETIIALYRFERQTVSKAMGGTLLGLRVALLLIALFWLVQPHWFKKWDEDSLRYVAVFVDLSASMELTDSAAPATEKLDLAQLFGLEVKDRPADSRDTQRKLTDLRKKFLAQANFLDLLSATDSSGARQAEARFTRLKELTVSAKELLAEMNKSLAQPSGDQLKLTSSATTLVAASQAQIKTLLEGPLARIEKVAAASGESQLAEIGAAKSDVRLTVEGLTKLEADSIRLPIELDEAYWQNLPAPKREEIEKQTNVARTAIARQVLTRKDPKAGDQSITENLSGKYALKFYHFASRSGPVPLETYLPQQESTDKAAEDAPKPAVKPATPAVDDKTAEAVAWRSATDLTGAMKLALKEIPNDRLSGLVVCWDGRHNAGEPLEALSGQLKTQRIPAISVLIGSRHIPQDVAVSEFDLPTTVMTGDKLAIKAKLKLDGYRGQDLVARLMRGKDELGRQTIKVPEDRHHPAVEFSDTAKQLGTYPYRIEILTAAGTPVADKVTDNNSAERTVTVTDDRVKVLLVENQVRWDFRYLKNQFSGQDKLVQLQYMLTNPSRLADAPAAPPVHVSASRPPEHREGTRLPENEKEWMKFDVIILGDLPPSTLTQETIAILDKFVFQRGGTLIVLAGPDYMPHAYGDTKLKEMIPMRCDKIEGSLRQGPDSGYRVRVTDDGRQHQVMKQITGKDSNEFWEQQPVFRWRHPKARAKEGAVRLAFAQSAYKESSASDKKTAEQLAREERNCLIAIQSYGAGKVMMLSCDEWWRLRYRTGPAYHHRFWADAIRWGADEKLQAGTANVRLGTDKPRYNVGEEVTIKAKLLNEKSDPIPEAIVDAKVFRGDKLLTTVRLNPKPGIPGRYEAPLGTQLDAGIYRVELAGTSVDSLLTGEIKKVDTEISVSAAQLTSELVELTADGTKPAVLGEVLAPIESAKILELLGEKSRPIQHSKDLILWDTLPVMLLFLAIGSAEWILRKKAGLT